jgi:RNA-directed DNA polymerase
MSKKLTPHFLQKVAQRFCNIRHLEDLSELLGETPYHISMVAAHPQYHLFTVPKKNGKKRWIEDPDDTLQSIQDKLAFYFSVVYYLNKTAAAYGFILSVKNEKDPRHIVTNAQQHLGKKYLFNADMLDFFHQVKSARLEKIFDAPPFNFNAKLIRILTDLCTNQGRLPMGAPTSPVLSNFATIEMDKELLTLAQWAEWRYTRYADDLSFSADTPFKASEIEQIKGIVEKEGYVFNPDKFKLLGPDDEKLVTGVKLGKDKVEVPDGFLEDLHSELNRLRHVTEVAHRMGHREKWVEQFRQQVTGKVSFVQLVTGADDPVASALYDQLLDANDPPYEFGEQSWLDFGYF